MSQGAFRSGNFMTHKLHSLNDFILHNLCNLKVLGDLKFKSENIKDAQKG